MCFSKNVSLKYFRSKVYFLVTVYKDNGAIVFDESKLLKELVVCDNFEGLISYLNSNQVNLLPTNVSDRISNKLFSVQQPLIRDLEFYKLSSIEELIHGLKNNQVNFNEVDYKKVCQALNFLLR